MSNQGLSIKQAANATGLSEKQVRRLIKEGRIPAELHQGKYGPEYRILAVPPALAAQKPLPKTPAGAMDIIRELQETNLQLAGQLGAAQERIRTLENQVRLLAAASKQPWWRRLFKRAALRKEIADAGATEGAVAGARRHP